AEGDETWVPWLIDNVYGTTFHANAPSNPGKNVGWTDWTHAYPAVAPRVSTTAANANADDPAIWIHPNDPSLSLIIGTDKGDSPIGGLFAWNMDGTQHQYFSINHPNNVDIRYGMLLGGVYVDIAAVTMRNDNEIRIFKIDPLTRTLSDITIEGGIPVYSDPYGICLYKRPSDGAMFAFISSARHSNNTLWQVLLEDDGTGKVKGTKIREFATITDVMEGMVADDELGYLYVSEEKIGVHKYYADPELGNDRLALFATGDAIAGDREGLAIYKCPKGKGYILLSSQGNTTVKVYQREGEIGNPHQHELITTISTIGSSATDGLDVTNLPISMTFPHGFLVTHNSDGNNFNLYAWEDFAFDSLRICDNVVITVPVELATFSAEVRGQDVYLRWVTSTESNNLGFEIQRRIAQGDFQKIAFVAGSGTTSQWRNYAHLDRKLEVGSYFYRLKQIDTDGAFTYSAEVKVVMSAPRVFALQDNYPNPFRGQTQIRFQLPQAEEVQLVIYNLLGREVKKLANQKLNAGYHTFSWDAFDNSGHPAPNGIYFYKLITPAFSSTRKMILMR
ncbi:MAG: phytase, partial [Anaerolineae bacterium]|nr:phytase [Anaerolineae bacterium]